MSISEMPPQLNREFISIKFSFSFFDLLKCRFWRLNHQPAFLAVNLIASVILPLLGFWNQAASSQAPVSGKIIAFIILMTMMYIFIMLVNLLLQIILILSNKNKGLVGTIELKIQNDGLVEKTEVSESLFRWAGFHKIRSSKNYLFLYVTESNALYVPKRAFQSDREAAQFQDQILRRTGG